MSTPTPTSSRGTTLLEMVASIVITSIIAVTVMPMINGAVDAHSQASSIRRETESISFAMERIVRTLRDAPAGSTTGTVGFSAATSSSFTLSDGRSFSLASGEITMRQGGTNATLCRNVTVLDFTYLGENGITSTSGSLAQTRRVNIRIVGSSVELRSSAFIRVGMTP